MNFVVYFLDNFVNFTENLVNFQIFQVFTNLVFSTLFFPSFLECSQIQEIGENIQQFSKILEISRKY